MFRILQKIETWFYKCATQRNLVYLGFLGAFVAIFALNYFFPIYADDMMYRVVKFQESVNLGENLKEIGNFMHYYYFNWGGRVVAIGSVHLLLLFNTLGQDIINSLVFISLLYVVYQICRRDGANHFFLFTFLAISIFYFTPSFLSSAVWITGSGVFLLTTTLTLAFVYPYYKYANGNEPKNSFGRIVFFLFFGILAAWSNENTGPTLFLLVVSMLGVMHFYKKRTIPLWATAGLIGVVIGCCLMILSPGNAVRAEMEGYESLFNSVDSMYDRLQHNIMGSYRHFMLRPIILFIVFFLLHHFYVKDQSRKKDTIIYALIFFIIANISIWVTILAPSFPPRAFMVITVLTIISIGILYNNIDFIQIVPKCLNIVFLATLLFYASIDYVTYLKGTYFLHKEMQKREAIIKQSLDEGKTSVTLEAIHMDYRFEYTDFANYYKDYYGVDANFVE